MKMLSILVFASLMIVALPAGVADHGNDSNGRDCATDDGALSIADTLYVSSGLFVYEESNNAAGLQTGSDMSPVGDSDSGDCTHPDTLLV